MSDVKDGGPAFPHQAPAILMTSVGLSVRDWFAGQALAGVCRPTPDGWSLSPYDHATWAYQIADAMLAERAALSAYEGAKE